MNLNQFLSAQAELRAPILDQVRAAPVGSLARCWPAVIHEPEAPGRSSMKTNLFAMAVIALVVTGCESEAEQRAKWIKACAETEFSEKQCAILYGIQKSANDSNTSAAIAAGMSGAAMGMAAGSSSSSYRAPAPSYRGK